MSTGTRVVGCRVERGRVRKGIPQVNGKARNDESSGCLVTQGLVNARRNYASQNYAGCTNNKIVQQCARPLACAIYNTIARKMKSSTADFNRATLGFLARLNEASFEYLNLYDSRAHDNGVTLGMGKPQRGFFHRF